MALINSVSDFIITKLTSDRRSDLNHLKLQKLLYYSQAWSFAFEGKALFEGKFQAWVHGPVNREIYNVYKDQKFLYSLMTISDVKDPEHQAKLTENEILHIDSILDAYAKFSPGQLEYMTHREEPWLAAREGVPPHVRSENVIDEKLMESYYKARL